MAQGGRERPDSGMATAEFAVGMVTLLLVLALVLGAARAGMDRAAAVSAAGAAAREAARGGDAGAVWGDLSTGLPAGSTLTSSGAGPYVRVHVSVPVRAGLIGVALPDRITVEAVALRENAPPP